MPRERQLFVAGLAPGYTQEQLYELFNRFGAIEASSVTSDAKKKTIGFVTFLDPKAARNAETLLHGKRINGVGPLVVVPALSRSEKNETNSSSAKNQIPPDPSVISKLQAAMLSSHDTPPNPPLNLAQRQRQKFLAAYNRQQQLQQQQQQQFAAARGARGDIVDKLLAAGMSGDDVSKCMSDDQKTKEMHLAHSFTPSHDIGRKHPNSNNNVSRQANYNSSNPMQALEDKDSRILELEKEVARLKESSMNQAVLNASNQLNPALLRGGAGRQGLNTQKPLMPSSLLGNFPLPTMPNLGLPNDDFQKQLQVLQLQSQLLPQSLLPTTLPLANSEQLQQAYSTILNHQQQQLQLQLQQQQHP
eukprot:TRINITY_DN6784_c0_g2_i2.p1 TRINITY_DN6784_c0_g2~~TRINITY_DN6784_c0_g2_i2.p1  ORF type:complete len:360 (+),score=119.54 TRINITY_DN6784_c0_g2_i2:92-1171(+)